MLWRSSLEVVLEAAPPRVVAFKNAILPLQVSTLLSFMTVVVKDKKQLVVPPSVSRRAGIKPGDRLEFKVSGGIINIIPILPSADDEYTPAQRKIIDTQLREAAKGPYYGPFETADSAIEFLRQEIHKRKAEKTKTTRR
jgi:AbrB family looped-hinge helix DNA binding protein